MPDSDMMFHMRFDTIPMVCPTVSCFFVNFNILWHTLSSKMTMKALTALVGRLFSSVDWGNDPEENIKLFPLTLNFL